MRSHPSLLPWVALAAVLLAPGTSAGAGCDDDGGTPRDRARAHFQAGISAYDAKRYSEAVDHLTCADQVLPNPAFAYNIAVTYEAMGDVPTALRWYREHRRRSGPDASTDALQAKLSQLESKLQARGVQQVSVLSEPAGAMLSIDERPLGLTPLTLELNPGSHRYRLTLAGREPAEGSFELRVDRSLDVRAELVPEREEPPALAAPPPATPHTDADPAGPLAAVGTWTWISLGTGTLLLGGAVGFELRRAQMDAELGRAPQADYQERYDAMTTQQTVARVLAGVGGAALIGGGVLLIHDLSKDESGSDLGVSTCTGQGLCFSASGAF